MICPRCGFEQPESPECARCGVFRGTFGVGEVLRETFSIYLANLLPFSLLTALALAPAYLSGYFVVAPGLRSPISVVSASLAFVVLLSPHLAAAPISFWVYQQLRGKRTSVAECLSRRGLLRLPVFGLILVQAVLIGFGAMLCLVPGIIVAVRLTVSIPAAAIEGTGVYASMNRSMFLTEGLLWAVFVVLFVLGFINIGDVLLVNLAAVKNPTLLLLLTGVKDLLFVGLSATGSAVLYYRLRGAKELIDVDQVSSVFA